MRLVSILLAASCVLFLRVSPLAAQESSVQPPPAEAVELYRQGRELYQQGRYRDALLALQRAAALDPTSANLAYNVARVQELLGEIDPAIRSYHRYLDLLPATQADEHARVEGIIRRLEGARGEVGGAHPVETQPTQDEALRDVGPVVVRERGVADVAFFATAGTAAAFLIAGTVCGIRALGLQSEASDFVVGRDGSLSQHEALVANANTFAMATDIAFGVGAALAVTSGLLYFLRSRDTEHYPEGSTPTPVPEVSVNTQGFMLSLRGSL
ncbi:MAG: tetratricopeptide repeat protein [Sandaracinaceae bacterium]|nr:tetratricopeptide repeat protein [Sandaracinaceae bacterium]